MRSNKNFILMILAMILVTSAFAIDLINPQAEGNFEDANHGWTIVNADQDNKWVVGNATASAGTKSIYISDDETTHHYDLTTTSTVFFYRDVTIPAGASDINLKFKMIGNGEGTSTIYDYVQVFMLDPSVTPVAGTLLTENSISPKINLVANWTQKEFILNDNGSSAVNKRLVFMWRNDSSGGTQPPAGIDEIQLSYNLATTVPNPAITAVPADLAISQAILPSFSWANGGSGPTGYKFYFGTTNDPTLVSDLGNVTTYTSTTSLEYNTTYYWKVVPYNSFGDAVNCPVWSFTTRINPTLNVPFTVDFEGSVFPPLDWTKFTGILADPSVLTTSTSGWYQDDYTNNTAVVNKSARLEVWSTTTKYWLVTPPIQLGANNQLEFDMALTEWDTSGAPETTGVDDKFAVVISTDNGVTWTSANTLKLWDNAGSPNIYNNISITGQHVVIDLSAYSGLVKIAFYGESSVTNADNNIYVDNVQVRTAPAAPLFTIAPESKNFGMHGINTNSEAQIFTISNTGSGEIIVNSIQINGTNASDFTLINTNTLPMTVTSTESKTVSVTFHPTTIGAKTAELVVTDNLGRTVHNIPLTAECQDPTVTSLPYGDDFDGEFFPKFGWINNRVAGTGTPGVWDKIAVGTNPVAQPVSGNGLVRFKAFSFSAGTRAILATPEIVFPTTTLGYRVKLNMFRDEGYPTKRERIKVYVGTELDTLTATLLGTVNRYYGFEPVEDTTGWNEYSFALPTSVAGTTQKVFIEGISEYGNDIMIDNFLIEEAFSPMPPRNLSVATTSTTATLTWLAPETRALTSYKIYRDNAEVAVVSSTTLNYTDAQLATGNYSYKVTALYTNPDGESVPSNVVNAHVGAVLYPPTGLTAVVSNDDVTLNWSEAGPAGTWITHAGNTYSDAVGTNDVANFTVAQRFTSAQLTNLDVVGGQLTKIRFMAHEPAATYTVKVWTGGSATPYAAGTEVTSQVVSAITVDEWTSVVLTTPITIPATGELWIGYNVNTPSGFPAGVDDTPAVNGFGNMMYFQNEWAPLTELSDDLNNNWLLQAQVLVEDASARKAIKTISANNTDDNIPVSENVKNSPFHAIPVTARTNRSLTGYKVLRGTTLLTTTPLPATTLTYQDMNVAQGTYTYNVIAVYTEGESVPASVEATVTATLPLIFEDTFESYPNFSLVASPWTFIDQDGAGTYGFQDITFEHTGEPMAFIVFNPSATTPAIPNLTGHSGSKMLASFCAAETSNNDWMISPAIHLNAGQDASVKFWVKSHTAQYGFEKFNVYVGTSAVPAQMTALTTTAVSAPIVWTEMTYPLNAYLGQTIYIAIQCVSNDAFVFYVDDFRVYGSGSVPTDNPPTPSITKLNGNYPNPFNPTTTISYSVKEKANVSIEVYNIKGQKVRSLVNEVKNQGNHTVLWNGKDDSNKTAGSGIYFYRMKSGKFTATGKMILMK